MHSMIPIAWERVKMVGWMKTRDEGETRNMVLIPPWESEWRSLKKLGKKGRGRNNDADREKPKGQWKERDVFDQR